MPFDMTKKQVMETAKAFNINIDGMTWPEQYKTIKNFLNEEPHHEYVDAPLEPEKNKKETITITTVNRNEPIGNVLTTIISPEIREIKNQILKYDEVLGDEVEVEEVYYDVNNLGEGDNHTGTYRIKGKRGGKKIIAQSTTPKQNAKITYNPNTDLVPVVEWKGKRGYLWQHATLPSIKQLLNDAGYYEKYRTMFNGTKNPSNAWYAAGKQMVVSIPLVHHVFNEIEKDWKRNHE